LGIENVVSFCGKLRHAETIQRLGTADVLVFPSIHEFGGAVVFEALAMGVVPVVVDFGGPGDVVHPDVGFKVPLTNEDDVVSQVKNILANLDSDSALLDRLREQGIRYAREYLSWNKKAEVVTEILSWATDHGPKPDLRPPAAAPRKSLVHKE